MPASPWSRGLLGGCDPKSGAAARLLDPLDFAHAVCQQIRDPSSHPVCYHGAYANRDPSEAESALEAAGEGGNTAQIRYDLRRATAKPEHATKEYRESMLRSGRLNREIMEAWAKHGGAEGAVE